MLNFYNLVIKNWSVYYALTSSSAGKVLLNLASLLASRLFLMWARFCFGRLMFYLFSGAQISFTKKVTKIFDPSNAKICKFTFSKVFSKELFVNV